MTRIVPTSSSGVRTAALAALAAVMLLMAAGASAAPLIPVETFGTGSGEEDWSAQWTVNNSSSPPSNGDLFTGTSTPSSNTGPQSALDGAFLYYEASSGASAGNPRYLTAVGSFDAAAYEITVSFYYNMYGNGMGTLNLQVNSGSGWTTVWTMSGNQGTSWSSLQTVDLAALGYTSGTVNIRFEFIYGSSYQSDIAIDTVTIDGTPTVTCTRSAPTVSLSPASQTITTDAGTAVYTLAITNNDDAACADETFSLSANDSNGVNFGPSAVSQSSVVLAPGETSSTITLTAAALAGETSGTNISSITAGSANHADATANSVTTTLSVVVCPSTPPAAPTGITISSMRTGGPTLIWNSVDCADNYNIYRSTDGASWGTAVATASAPSTSGADTTAPMSNTQYVWTVTAVNAYGESGKPAGSGGRTALIPGYNMVAAPYNTTGQSPSAVFGVWAYWSFTWVPTGNVDPDNNGYYLDATEVLPGSAVFTWAWNDATVLTASGAANPASITVTLLPGWNAVSNQTLATMTNIGTAWVVDGSMPLSAAVTANIIGGSLYWWNGGTYDSWTIASNPAIDPWKGYWILNMDSVNHTLTIQ